MSEMGLGSEGLLERAVRALCETPVPEEGLADALTSARAALAEAKQTYGGALEASWPTRSWRLLMRHKGMAVSSAAALLATAVALLLSQLPVPKVAFAEVMEKMAQVQTLHMKFTRGGRTGEAWLKRPNMMRVEYEDGTYEIHNGPTEWIVDQKANKATRGSSWYYRDAQRRGVDTVDMLIDLPQTKGLSGFFSEGPVGQIRQDGRLFDVYKMDFEERGGEFRFEALADARTHILHSVKLEVAKDRETKTVFALAVLDYDQPIPNEKFTFQPPEGMAVTVQEPKPQEAALASQTGSTLSGRIVWASTGKPVPDASVTLSAGDYVQDESGRSRQEFFTRAKTDREGRWEVSGVPAGRARISPRSWELNWPSVPTFKNRLGSLEQPNLQVDGKSSYDRLDFTVYKPKELFARITASVTDEDGRPVEGIAAYLMGDPSTIHDYGRAGVEAGPGKWFSGADGKLDDRDVWPTEQPVRLHVYHPEERRPFVTRAVATEPFVVESKKSYHFDLTVPYERKLRLRVVNPDGQPLESVLVTAREGSGGQVFPPYRPSPGGGEERVFTDGNGRATVGRLMPEEVVIIVLRRLPRQDAEWASSVATTWASVRVPKDREPSSLEVTFDDRPVRIEGKVPLPPEPWRAKHVYCIVDRGPDLPGLEVSPWSNADESGRFALTGVPAGDVRLKYLLVMGEAVREWQSKNTIRTEPGNAYTVEVVGEDLRVIGTKPIP